ncbi:MAG: hypothetical protein ABIR24_00055 [Verrucomicrobiota bacterium]
MQTSQFAGKTSGKTFIVLLILLLAVLCVLFRQSFDPNKVLFANDLPLGALKAEQSQLPGTFTGNWQDSNWIGAESISAAPNITALFGTIFPPEIMVKMYPPFAMLWLGLCAWLCFRELGFRPIVCILGGLAAGLNMHAFSFAAWGLSHWVISLAMMFLAIAALVSKSIKRGWIRGILAGTAVGVGLMEGFDVGAIFSLFIGVFGFFAGLVTEKISARTITKSALVVALIAIFAGLTAAHTLSSLIGTQVKGIVGMAQDKASKEKRWFEATQWSLPKKEALRILIPGIFGYRMDTKGTGELYEKSYWGAVAQTPGYEDPGENYHKGLARHSGSGEYAGIFVLLVAILAVAQSFRKQNSPFTLIEKKFVWFWSAIAVVSLLLAFGRHAPFYQFFFALPYASTIRNTLKFLNPFHVALLILFGYGLESLVRRYFEIPAAKATAPKNSSAFEKKWIVFSSIALGAGVLGWMLYAASKRKLLSYLESHFPRETAAHIAEFSLGEAGWFVLFFAASVVLVLMILRGKFAGKLKVAGILMGALIVVDLAHADVPWIVYYNYKEKYQSNPIIEFLREKSFAQRVVGMLPFRVNETLSSFQQFYYTEWLQHHFYYYNIQTLDFPQEPRTAADNAAYRETFLKTGAPGLIRMWQLTNVRYLLGLTGGFVDSILNQQIDPEQKRFRLLTPFSIAQENRDGPYLIQTNSTGPFALIEFTGALPRVKLYSNWQVVTNNEAALNELADARFDPFKTVLVANQIPLSSTNSGTDLSVGAVQITSYHPKRIELAAKAEAPSVLLLNDKYDSKWKVFVDGQEKPLLRANFIMRGVQLEKGDHKIEFRFQPRLNTLYISLAALGIGLALCAFVAFGKKKNVEVSSLS